MKRGFLSCVVFVLGLVNFAFSEGGPTLKSYPLDDRQGLIVQSEVQIDQQNSTDGGGSLKISVTRPTLIKLYNTGELNVQNANLVYQANIRTESVTGPVYLQMTVIVSSKDPKISLIPEAPLTGTTSWTEQEVGVPLQQAEQPADVQLGLVINGSGTVWIDDVRITKEPLKKQGLTDARG